MREGGGRRRPAVYLARAPVAEDRLSVDRDGLVVYELKRPFSDGTTHVLFEPIDFIARLAALVPRPRAHLVRYHGVFAPSALAPASPYLLHLCSRTPVTAVSSCQSCVPPRTHATMRTGPSRPPGR